MPVEPVKKKKEDKSQGSPEEKVDVAKIRKGTGPDDDIIMKPKIKKEKGVVEKQMSIFDFLDE